jgi:SAM-dependent methyltransferase
MASMTFARLLKPRLAQTVATVLRRLRGQEELAHPLDRALGIETSVRVPRAAFSVGSDKDALSVGYVGAAPSIIRKSLDAIGVGRDSAFVDLGCGKGRALVVAADYPFRSIAGIELSPFLADIARRNIGKLNPKARYGDRIVIIEGDASSPAIPEVAEVILFLYNPFRRPLVETLAAGLVTAIKSFPSRKLWLVYYNPVCHDVFDRAPEFERFMAARIDYNEDERRAAERQNSNTFDSVIIYQSRNSPRRSPLPGADARVKITIPDLGADVINAP